MKLIKQKGLMSVIEVDGKKYKITKHARRRFKQRFGSSFSELRLIKTALKGVDGYTFVFKPDNADPSITSLVTVLFEVDESQPKNGPEWKAAKRKKFLEDAYLYNCIQKAP